MAVMFEAVTQRSMSRNVSTVASEKAVASGRKSNSIRPILTIQMCKFSVSHRYPKGIRQYFSHFELQTDLYINEFMLLLNDIYRKQEVTFSVTSILLPGLDSSYENNFYRKSHLELCLILTLQMLSQTPY